MQTFCASSVVSLRRRKNLTAPVNVQKGLSFGKQYKMKDRLGEDINVSRGVVTAEERNSISVGGFSTNQPRLPIWTVTALCGTMASVRVKAQATTMAAIGAVVLILCASTVQGQFVGGQVVCETSGGSPSVGDAQGLVNWLSGRGTCAQTNCNGGEPKCTTMGTEGSAAVSICTRGPACCNCGSQDCSRIARLLQQVIDQCQSNGLVGGIYQEYTRETGGLLAYSIFHS